MVHLSIEVDVELDAHEATVILNDLAARVEQRLHYWGVPTNDSTTVLQARINKIHHQGEQ